MNINLSNIENQNQILHLKRIEESLHKEKEAFEAEYIILETDQKNILYSNEEMLRLMPNDTDSIESRALNLKCYNRNLIRMKEIKARIETTTGKVNTKDNDSYDDVIKEITL